MFASLLALPLRRVGEIVKNISEMSVLTLIVQVQVQVIDMPCLVAAYPASLIGAIVTEI